jgi:hypothetical protein
MFFLFSLETSVVHIKSSKEISFRSILHLFIYYLTRIDYTFFTRAF